MGPIAAEHQFPWQMLVACLTETGAKVGSPPGLWATSCTTATRRGGSRRRRVGSAARSGPRRWSGTPSEARSIWYEARGPMRLGTGPPGVGLGDGAGEAAATRKAEGLERRRKCGSGRSSQRQRGSSLRSGASRALSPATGAAECVPSTASATTLRRGRRRGGGAVRTRPRCCAWPPRIGTLGIGPGYSAPRPLRPLPLRNYSFARSPASAAARFCSYPGYDRLRRSCCRYMTATTASVPGRNSVVLTQ